MKPLLNANVRAELELDRPPRSAWEGLFRLGVRYLVVTTFIGSLAEAIFGEHKGPIPLWGWLLVVLYLFFMAYCSNYAVARYVKSRFVRIAWWCLMGFIALVLIGALCARLVAVPASESTLRL